MRNFLIIIRVLLETLKEFHLKINQRQKNSLIRAFYKFAELAFAGIALAGILQHATPWYVIAAGILGAIVAFILAFIMEGFDPDSHNS